MIEVERKERKGWIEKWSRGNTKKMGGDSILEGAKFDRFYNLSFKLCFLVVFEYKYYFNKCYCLVAHTELKTGFTPVLISV
jgi:hypothetical protein